MGYVIGLMIAGLFASPVAFANPVHVCGKVHFTLTDDAHDGCMVHLKESTLNTTFPQTCKTQWGIWVGLDCDGRIYSKKNGKLNLQQIQVAAAAGKTVCLFINTAATHRTHGVWCTAPRVDVNWQ